jgi:hypothetical protein
MPDFQSRSYDAPKSWSVMVNNNNRAILWNKMLKTFKREGRSIKEKLG